MKLLRSKWWTTATKWPLVNYNRKWPLPINNWWCNNLATMQWSWNLSPSPSIRLYQHPLHPPLRRGAPSKHRRRRQRRRRRATIARRTISPRVSSTHVKPYSNAWKSQDRRFLSRNCRSSSGTCGPSRESSSTASHTSNSAQWNLNGNNKDNWNRDKIIIRYDRELE